MSADDDYLKAKRDAERARARLSVTATELKTRLAPSSFAQETLQGLKESTVAAAGRATTAVKAHPLAVTAAIGAVAAFLFRGAIRRKLTAAPPEAETETPAPAESPPDDPKPKPRRAPRRAPTTPRRTTPRR